MLEKNKGPLINLPQFISKEGTGKFMNTNIKSSKFIKAIKNQEDSMVKGYNDLTSLSSSKIILRATSNEPVSSLSKSSKFGLKVLLDKQDETWGDNTPRINLKTSHNSELRSFDQTPQLSMRGNSDYASLLMYVPNNIQSLTVKNSSTKGSSKGFNSFTELAKTTRNNEGRLFEGIIKRNAFLQDQEEQEVQVDRIDMMKKILNFNQKQKVNYVQQINEEKKNVILPFVTQIKDRSKKKLNIKVLPSKRLIDDNAGSNDGGSPKHQDEIIPVSFYGFSAPSSPAENKRRNSRRNSHRRNSSVNMHEDQTFFVNYKIFWNHNLPHKSTWRPCVREGHTFTTVGKYMILYGGVSNVVNNQISIFDPANNAWTNPTVKGEIPANGRHGHTACEYNKHLIVFGGEQQFNKTLRMRECLNDVQMFNPETNEWKYLKAQSQLVPARRYHTAVIYERFMYIYGGISNEGVYMKDVWALNLKTKSWDKIEITGDRETGIAFHTMATCYIDRFSSKEREKALISEEGVYVFGGKDSQGKILDTLKYFTVESRVPQWKYPQTKGTPPIARYNHSMLLYANVGILVIYGGKNDLLYKENSDVCLNDIKILNLKSMAWATLATYGTANKIGRHLHAATIYGSKMFIFGGMEFYNYASDEIQSIELSQSKVKKILDLESYGELTRLSIRNSIMGGSHFFDNKTFKNPPPMYMPDEMVDLKPALSFLPMPKEEGGLSAKNRSKSKPVINLSRVK